MKMIYHIAYFSNSTTDLSISEMEELLITFRESNEKIGVTGILLYLDRCFLQIIEGAKENVTELFNIIQTDPRHDQILRIYSGTTQERTFKEWSMGFEPMTMTKYKSMAGFNDLSNTDFVEKIIKTNHPRIQRTIKTFYSGGLA